MCIMWRLMHSNFPSAQQRTHKGITDQIVSVFGSHACISFETWNIEIMFTNSVPMSHLKYCISATADKQTNVAGRTLVYMKL